MKIIDVGCGGNSYIRKTTYQSSSRFPVGDIRRVKPDVGIDVRPLLAQGGIKQFVQGDMRHIPYPDKYFDVAIYSHCLEHLPDRFALLESLLEMRRIAKSAHIYLPSFFQKGITAKDHHFIWLAGRFREFKLGLQMFLTIFWGLVYRLRLTRYLINKMDTYKKWPYEHHFHLEFDGVKDEKESNGNGS